MPNDHDAARKCELWMHCKIKYHFPVRLVGLCGSSFVGSNRRHRSRIPSSRLFPTEKKMGMRSIDRAAPN
jgi:hypothetical protein